MADRIHWSIPFLVLLSQSCAPMRHELPHDASKFSLAARLDRDVLWAKGPGEVTPGKAAPAPSESEHVRHLYRLIQLERTNRDQLTQLTDMRAENNSVREQLEDQRAENARLIKRGEEISRVPNPEDSGSRRETIATLEKENQKLLTELERLQDSVGNDAKTTEVFSETRDTATDESTRIEQGSLSTSPSEDAPKKSGSKPEQVEKKRIVKGSAKKDPKGEKTNKKKKKKMKMKAATPQSEGLLEALTGNVALLGGGAVLFAALAFFGVKMWKGRKGEDGTKD